MQDHNDHNAELLKRALPRARRIAKMRVQKVKWQVIAEKLGISRARAQAIYTRYQERMGRGELG